MGGVVGGGGLVGMVGGGGVGGVVGGAGVVGVAGEGKGPVHRNHPQLNKTLTKQSDGKQVIG